MDDDVDRAAGPPSVFAIFPDFQPLDATGPVAAFEICDGDPPHRPVGCSFQAWSLAEALRIDRLLG